MEGSTTSVRQYDSRVAVGAQPRVQRVGGARRRRDVTPLRLRRAHRTLAFRLRVALVAAATTHNISVFYILKQLERERRDERPPKIT